MLGKQSTKMREDLITIGHRYKAAHNVTEVTMSEVAQWAIDNDMWQYSRRAAVKQLTNDLAEAHREQTHEDPQGRVVRTYLASKVERMTDTGVISQQWLWADIRDGNHPHAVAAFSYRRTGIRCDVRKLKTDIASYNANYKPQDEQPIQMSFNFDDDEGEDELAYAG